MHSRKISTFDDAYIYAVKKLSISDCSSGEMSTYLIRRGCSKEIAQAVLNKLLEQNYINDKKLCLNICERWQQEGLYGKKMLQLKLLRRGFSKEIIDESLSFFDIDEYEKANKIFIAYVKKIKKFDDKTLGKIMRHMSAKGFSYQIVKSVISNNKSLLIECAKQPCLDTFFKNLYN